MNPKDMTAIFLENEPAAPVSEEAATPPVPTAFRYMARAYEELIHHAYGLHSLDIIPTRTVNGGYALYMGAQALQGEESDRLQGMYNDIASTEIIPVYRDNNILMEDNLEPFLDQYEALADVKKVDLRPVHEILANMQVPLADKEVRRHVRIIRAKEETLSFLPNEDGYIGRGGLALNFLRGALAWDQDMFVPLYPLSTLKRIVASHERDQSLRKPPATPSWLN